MAKTWALGLVGWVTLFGCAPPREGSASMQPETTGQPFSVRVGLPLLLDARVNPSAGVQVAMDGQALVVRFVHPRGPGAVERLDPASLGLISQTAQPAGPSFFRRDERLRVTVDGGRVFVLCWKSGGAEGGYRAVAQAFNASDGSPRGAAVFISPPNADVSGSLSAATFDGHHVVATFAASAGASFAAYAVALEAL